MNTKWRHLQEMSAFFVVNVDKLFHFLLFDFPIFVLILFPPFQKKKKREVIFILHGKSKYFLSLTCLCRNSKETCSSDRSLCMTASPLLAENWLEDPLLPLFWCLGTRIMLVKRLRLEMCMEYPSMYSLLLSSLRDWSVWKIKRRGFWWA